LLALGPLEVNSGRPLLRYGNLASKAIDFYKEAFGAEETIRMPGRTAPWRTRSYPFGQVWAMATHKEDLSEEEKAERSKAAMVETG
jgi:hypothetical protein